MLIVIYIPLGLIALVCCFCAFIGYLRWRDLRLQRRAAHCMSEAEVAILRDFAAAREKAILRAEGKRSGGAFDVAPVTSGLALVRKHYLGSRVQPARVGWYQMRLVALARQALERLPYFKR